MAASRNRSSITGALGVTLSLGLVLASGMSSGATTSRTLWVARYDGSGDFYDGASSVAASPDGAKVIVTGTSLAPGSDYDYATVAYDSSTGAKVWLKRYNGPRNGPDLASSIAISPDGSKVFVTGQSEGRGTNYDYATIAYDMSTGATQWVARYNGPGNDWDRANSIASSPDGSKVFVTGRSPGIETDDDYATVAYDASIGEELWVTRYDGPVNGSDEAFSVAVSPSGSSVFVTGQSFGPRKNDYATVAYGASTGTELWVMRYNGSGNSFDDAFSIAVSPDGSKVFVTGTAFDGFRDGGPPSWPDSGGLDYATVAYQAATGQKLWVTRYNGPGDGSDEAARIAASPDGSRVFVTGQSKGTGFGTEYATVAYGASDGAKLWARRYDGPNDGDDAASSVAVSVDGSKVFVTGYSRNRANSARDYATVAYDASTGGNLWASRYESRPGGDNAATSIAVSPDASKVFITGASTSAQGDYDYLTIAYPS